MRKEIVIGSAINAGQGTICLTLNAPDARKSSNARNARGLRKIVRRVTLEAATCIHCLRIDLSD